MKAVPVEKIEELIRKWRELADSAEVYASESKKMADRGNADYRIKGAEHARNAFNLKKCADELSALGAAAADVPVEAQGKPDVSLCKACHHPKDDSRFHLDAPGTNWGAALHWFEEPDERPAENDWGRSKSQDKRFVAQGKPRPVTDEQKREMVQAAVEFIYKYNRALIMPGQAAEEIVTHILKQVSPEQP